MSVVRLALCAAPFIVPPHAAAAQSFFEQLFGASPNRPAATVPPPAALPLVRATAVIAAPPATGIQSESASRTSRSAAGDGGAKYQTMCVRTCDGYYWPLNYPVSRRDFNQDQARCDSTCGSPTKLYYRPGPGTDPEEMRDLNGKSYGASETAFKYRKGLTDGCTCRLMPWSDAERARHEGYALAEAEKAARIAQAAAEKRELAQREAKRLAELAAASLRTSQEATAADPPGQEADQPVVSSAAPPEAPGAALPRGRRPAASKQEFAAHEPQRRKSKPPQPVAIAAPARIKVASVQAKPQASPFFLGGGQKFTYPGDAPVR